MNKSKIEWCDYTWSPVTGCLHGCPYCYARKIAHRYGTPYSGTDCHVITGKVNTYDDAVRTGPYPYEFAPTFHKYRLDEPKRKTKPSKIFVCSMADLFGDWVPTRWIGFVLEEVEKSQQHTFIFLTKNPIRYKYFNFPSNCWLGTTVTSQNDYETRVVDMTLIPRPGHKKLFLSIEPLLGEIVLNEYLMQWTDWIIVGAQTGPGAKPPKPEWVQSIIDQARAAGVPVFLKNNLNWPEKIQEWPEGMVK